MTEFGEETQSWRIAPPKGAIDSMKPYLVPPGYLREARNVVLDRRTMRRRPHLRKLNHTAAGASGIRLRREAVIPWSRHVSFQDADFTPAAQDLSLEFWFRTPTDAGFPDTGDHRVPVAYQGSRASLAAGYAGGPAYTKVRTIDGPFTLNLARLSGEWLWELYTHPGFNRISVKASPYIRQHVSVTIDATSGDIILRNSDDGEGNEVTATMAAGLATGRQHWRFSGPAEKADTPENPPYFELECIRIWHAVRTPAEIQDNRDHALPGDTPGLIGQWTGDKGTRDHLLNEAGVDLPMFFTADYPSHYAGAYGSGLEIAAADVNIPARYAMQYNVEDLLDGMTESLATTYLSLGIFPTAIAGTAFDQNELQYAVGMKVKMLETNLNDFSAVEVRGICTGQFDIFVNSVTGVVSVEDASNIGKIVTSGLVTIGPGESHVIAAERDKGSLMLYIDGVQVGIDGTLVIADASFTTNKYGIAAVANSVPGSILVEKLYQWYGKPTNAAGQNLLTKYPTLDFPDNIDARVTGDLIENIGGYSLTNGSVSGNATGAGAVPRIGDFLIDLTASDRRVAYRVDSVAANTFTLATAYTGATGSVAMAMTRCLFKSEFDVPWSTESNRTETKFIGGRTGNQNFLPNVIDDEIAVLRPLWLSNGVTGALNLDESSHLERTTKFAGLVKRDIMPSGGAKDYRKSGEIDARVAVWGTTLYWQSNGWFVRNNEHYGSGKYAILNLDRGYMYAASGSMFRVFDAGVASTFSFTADIEPGRIDGKRVLLIKGRKVDSRQLWLYLDDGKITAKIFYDNGAEANVVMQTDHAVVQPNEKYRIDVYINLASSAVSYIAVDREKVSISLTGFWVGGGDTINAVPTAAQSLFGINLKESDVGAFDDGMQSFVGYVYQVRVSGSDDSVLNMGMDDAGALESTADADLLMYLEEGEGWTLANDGQSSATGSIVNAATGLVPILEDIPHGDGENPYSLDLFRSTLYGTNGQGRQIYARWNGDFTRYPTGWETGFSGILPPKHFPRVTATKATLASGNTAGTYLVAYSYIDTSTGMRSNPSPIVKITLPTADVILFEDLQASADPRVDGIEFWMTQAGGDYMGKVALTGNEVNSAELDYTPASIRSSDPLVLTNDIPPVAKLIKFINGRAFWAGVEGSDGVLTFAQADYEESWDPLNQKQVDSSRWSPIVGIGGQRGAVHVYTRDSIFRAIDGGGDILTFQFGLVVSGVGAVDQHTLLEIDGNELFMSRDGLFAFNGAATQMIGAASEGAAIGIPGINRGADPRSVPMWAVWDPRRHVAMWFYRDLDDPHPTGTAICMSRRINDNAAWSTLDFYDVSAATEFESIDGIPGIMLLDSMGYAWELVDPLTDDQLCLDLDGLGATIEDGTARTLVGSWGTDSMLGHVAGDGGRGFVFMTYTVDAAGVVTGYGMNRLLRTPAAAILVADDAEQALGAWDKWVLGGFVQNMESSWGPYPAIEMAKEATLFDMGYSPLAGEEATIVFEGVSSVAGRSMDHAMSASASRVSVSLDKGYLEGIPLRLESRFRTFRYAVQYFGTQNFDVAEVVLRWNPEGGARGPGGA